MVMLGFRALAGSWYTMLMRVPRMRWSVAMSARTRSWPSKQDFAVGDDAGGAEIAHDGEGEGGFAAAGFADDAEAFALVEGEGEVGDGGQAAAHGVVFDAQVADVEQRFARLCRCFQYGDVSLRVRVHSARPREG